MHPDPTSETDDLAGHDSLTVEALAAKLTEDPVQVPDVETFGEHEELSGFLASAQYVQGQMQFHIERLAHLGGLVEWADAEVAGLSIDDEDSGGQGLAAYQTVRESLDELQEQVAEVREWLADDYNAQVFPTAVEQYDALAEQLATWHQHVDAQTTLCENAA